MALHHARDVEGDDGRLHFVPEPAVVLALHPPAAEARFSAVEVQVIALARADTLASLEPPGWWARAVALLFGVQPRARRLADAKLETLRRAIVVTRHRRHMPDAVAAELIALGYRPAQVRALEALAVAG